MMDDLISRQAAIEAVTKYCLKNDLRELLADIECLPTAEPQIVTMKLNVDPEDVKKVMAAEGMTLMPAEKKGKWIPVIDGHYITWECSECHVESDAWTDYCPICGSRNIEETDEEAYEEALEKFLQNPKTYTLDEVEDELGLTAEKKGEISNYCPNCGAKMEE